MAASVALVFAVVAWMARDPLAPEPLPSLESLNVIVIVIDTFGSEHAGGFHNPGLDHTPALDRLAQRGVVFRSAFAPAPWTQPSVASLFTSLMPSQHGVKSFGDHLPEDVETLAAQLKARGFKTGAVISNQGLVSPFGFASGFDWYDQSSAKGHEAITSNDVTDTAISWVDRNRDSRFFLFAHYFDPHYQYHQHPEHDLSSGYDGPLRTGMSIRELRDRRTEMSRDDIDFLIALHREEIAYTDGQVGRLLDHLAATGLEERTLVVLTSDHGEEFMRHGWIGHTRTLYDELMRVPLIVSLPGAIAPGVSDAPVSILDILPTILELSESPPARPNWTGRSLLPILTGADAGDADREILGEVSYDMPARIKKDREKVARMTSLLVGDFKLIHDLIADEWKLFDLDADPEELTNLYDHDHPAVMRWRPVLERWEATRDRVGRDAPRRELSDAEIERLRGLGYVR